MINDLIFEYIKVLLIFVKFFFSHKKIKELSIKQLKYYENNNYHHKRNYT